MPVNQYDLRDRNVSQLGFRSYSDYLRSPIWRLLRRQQLTEFPDCCICRQSADQVHHLSYDYSTITGSDRRYLVSICDGCHYQIERDSEGKKRSFEATSLELISVAKNEELEARIREVIG